MTWRELYFDQQTRPSKAYMCFELRESLTTTFPFPAFELSLYWGARKDWELKSILPASTFKVPTSKSHNAISLL